MECEHRNTEYIPYEYETNTKEDVICLDCGKSIINKIDTTIGDFIWILTHLKDVPDVKTMMT